MPVRRIGLCYRSVSGRIPIGTGNPVVVVESTLERDFVLLQRFDLAVAGIEEQPVRIVYRTPDGGRRRYVPDFLVSYRDARRPSRLVEVKLSTDPALTSGALEQRFDAARRHAADSGWVFDLATEREIRTPRLANATFLLPFRDRALDPVLRASLLEALAARQPLPIRELVDAVARSPSERVRVLPTLWSLIARFEVAVDLDRPVTMETLLHLPEEGHP